MWRLRVLGLAMVVYGAGTLVLLATPWRDWALDHSVAELASWSDRRANNEVTGEVDEPMAIAGSAVLTFAGLWVGLLVPFVLNRNQRAAARSAGHTDPPARAGPPGGAPA